MIKRRVFISCQHADQMKAKGFNLMRFNKHLDIEFVGRHLLDPVDSKDPAYIKRKIQEQMDGCSATVVLIGNQTADSDWVDHEIAKSVEQGKGIIGVRLEAGAEVPNGLTQAGAEILEWNEVPDQFNDAIERAIAATNRRMPLNTASTCARA